jgi:low affinity Fe/Cu permease
VVLVVIAVTVWIAVSIAAGFPTRWETIFQTLVAALTLTMVFVIQRTQARHQRATQRKLDEILLAMPGTDNSLLRLEYASDEELRAAGDQHREIRQTDSMTIWCLVQPTQRRKLGSASFLTPPRDRSAHCPHAADHAPFNCVLPEPTCTPGSGPRSPG